MDHGQIVLSGEKAELNPESVRKLLSF